jgi:hypothetical protein
VTLKQEDECRINGTSLLLASLTLHVALGGLVVSVLPIRLKIWEFKPGRGRWILRAIKIRSTTSFGGEVKLSVPCRKILRHVKDPYSMKEILRKQNLAATSPQFSPASLLDVSDVNFQSSGGRSKDD